MWVKRFTSAFVVLLAVALVGWPWILGKRPAPGAPKKEYKMYATRSGAYILFVIVGIVGAGIGSYLIIREERRRYAEEARANLESLIAGVQSDRQQKQVERLED